MGTRHIQRVGLTTVAACFALIGCSKTSPATSQPAVKTVSCDQAAAKATLDSGPDLADVDTTNGITTWRIDPESWPPIMSNPQAFVRKVADANACVNHPLQHIILRDPDGKFLGETGPAGTHIN